MPPPEPSASEVTSCLQSRRVLLPEGLRAACLWVDAQGRIARISAHGEIAPGATVHDVGDAVLMPGIVDCHAHINEPGRTEWEGFVTATAAAAAGGITTLVDMPLNSIPATTSVDALARKAIAAEGRCAVDYGLWGGVIPGNAHELAPMVRAGALGFKAFLTPSGVDEFPHVFREDLERALPELARVGVPLLAHAEVELPGTPPWGDARAYRSYLASRPPEWEVEAIRLLIDLSSKFRARVHIVHLSAADALPLIDSAKRHGVPLTVETCPHYLTFAAEEIPDGATWFKCAPPIRAAENRERLWRAVRTGDIDCVVSDHSPCTPGLKHLERGDFEQAWGGIASLQFSLPAVWTGMQARGMGLELLVKRMCEATSELAGLSDRKGRLAVGMDADVVVFEPEARFTVSAREVLHRHKVTPYAGRRLDGVVRETWLRGERVFVQGEQPLPGRGRRLTRSAAPVHPHHSPRA